MKKRILVLAAVAALLSSCYNTKMYVGEVSPKDPVVEVNKEWNHHVLFGLVPLKNTKMETKEFVKDESSYVIKTNTSFVNYLVSALTFGIYTPTQTKYYIPVKSLKD